MELVLCPIKCVGLVEPEVGVRMRTNPAYTDHVQVVVKGIHEVIIIVARGSICVFLLGISVSSKRHQAFLLFK